LLLVPKEVFHIKKKKKGKCKTKKSRTKKKKNHQKCGCPLLPGLKLVQSGLSVLPDFTKPADLSDLTRAEN
jgi:hypothetical protein